MKNGKMTTNDLLKILKNPKLSEPGVGVFLEDFNKNPDILAIFNKYEAIELKSDTVESLIKACQSIKHKRAVISIQYGYLDRNREIYMDINSFELYEVQICTSYWLNEDGKMINGSVLLFNLHDQDIHF